MQCLSVAHTFDYIVLRINPGLTSFEDLATVVGNSLTIISVCNTSYVLPYRCMSNIANKSVSTIAMHAYYCIAILIQIVYKSKQSSI